MTERRKHLDLFAFFICRRIFVRIFVGSYCTSYLASRTILALCRALRAMRSREPRSSKCSAPDTRQACGDGRNMAGRKRAHFLVSALHPLRRIGELFLSSCCDLTHARIQAPPSSFRTCIQRYACVSSVSGSYKPTGDEEEFFLSLFERTSFFSKSGRYLYSREKEGTS